MALGESPSAILRRIDRERARWRERRAVFYRLLILAAFIAVGNVLYEYRDSLDRWRHGHDPCRLTAREMRNLIRTHTLLRQPCEVVTYSRMQALYQALLAYNVCEGEYPREFDVFVRQNFYQPGNSRATVYEYVYYYESDGSSFILLDPGPDGVVETDDDIRMTSPELPDDADIRPDSLRRFTACFRQDS